VLPIIAEVRSIIFCRDLLGDSLFRRPNPGLVRFVEFDNYGACMSVSEELLCAFELLKVLRIIHNVQLRCKLIAAIFSLSTAPRYGKR